MRIAIGGFQHETNTFAPSKADFAAFEQADAWPALQHGEPLLSAFPAMNIPISGFIEEASAQGHTLVPLVWCSATPSAHVTENAFDRVVDLLGEALEQALGQGIDAVYLDLHGAMVTEHLEDGEGDLLRRVRRLIGDDLPLIASLDLHANVTAQMTAHADALIAYRTYPHVDMAETGRRAARHLDKLFSGLPRQAKAFRKLDFLIPLPAQCTMKDPAAMIYSDVAVLEGALLGNGRVNSLSFTMGFAAADIAESGPAVLAYADTEAAAIEAAERIAQEVSDAEQAFGEKLWSPEDAVAHAIGHSGAGRGTGDAEGPFVLADTQDNPGAGGNGDTVGILRELIEQDAPRAALGVLYDPESAAAAMAAGVGARIDLALGAKTGGAETGGADEAPVEAAFDVEALSDGEALATGPFYGGSTISLGDTALLRIGGVRVVVSSKKVQCADRAMFTHIGVDPREMDVVVVKSSVHFRADFGPIARDVLVVEAPGPNLANHAKHRYRHLRKGVRLMPAGPTFQGTDG